MFSASQKLHCKSWHNLVCIFWRKKGLKITKFIIHSITRKPSIWSWCKKCKNFLSYSWYLATGCNDRMRNGLKARVMSIIDYVIKTIFFFKYLQYIPVFIYFDWRFFFSQANHIKNPQGFTWRIRTICKQMEFDILRTE